MTALTAKQIATLDPRLWVRHRVNGSEWHASEGVNGQGLHATSCRVAKVSEWTWPLLVTFPEGHDVQYVVWPLDGDVCPECVDAIRMADR